MKNDNPDNDDSYQPSIKECASMGRPFVEIPYDPDVSLRRILMYFPTQYNTAITEKRLRLLTFYTDYRYYQLHNEQLTNTRYKPRGDGFRSPDIKRELSNAPLTECTRLKNGDTVTAYTLDITSHLKNDSLNEFFEEMHNETSTVKTRELTQFHKNTPAFELTGSKEYLNFNTRTVTEMSGYKY